MMAAVGEPDRKSATGKISSRLERTLEVGPEDSTVAAALETDLSAAASEVDDSLLAAVAAAPGGGEVAELEPGAVIGGSFRIERRLGAGGMGVVYLAHDQRLGRSVAVKVHRASAGVERLHREAMAMARLAHPNVITVHEVGRVGADRVFVAMEYVAGGTFRSWLKARTRPWREVLAMCTAAGAGLAAAHDAGLVHRDFKPENVLVGDDGRPRVGDFGLARAIGDDAPDSITTAVTADGDAHASAPSASGSQRLSDRLTMTGALLGTPAYMAPEQFDGGAVDARADQFAFAVVTWEALHGARPFTGRDARALRAAIAAGALTTVTRSPVPARVRRVLARALAADRDARYPSVRALLDALAAASRPRRAWLALAAGAIALGAGGVVVARVTADPGDPCRTATAAVERALPSSLIARLRATLAGASGDRDALALIDARLGDVRGNLIDAARSVCKAARVSRDLSPELEARAHGCLRYRARATALVVDDEALLREAPATYALRLRSTPNLTPCLDSVALAASPPAPDGPAAEARALLYAAQADAAIDRAGAARTRIAEAERIEQSAHPERGQASASPTSKGGEGANAALATLVRGKLAYDEDRHAEAERLLTDAYYAAQAVDDTEVYLTALAQLIHIHGDDRLDPAKLDPWMRTAEAVVQRDRRRARQGVLLVMRALAAAADRRGDGAGAVAWAEQAAALVSDAVDPLVRAEAEYGLAQAYASAGRFDDARPRYEAALPVFERTYGASHPHHVAILTDYALVLSEATLVDEAYAIADRAQAALAAWPGARSGDRANALLNIGVLLTDHPERYDDARAALVAARDLYAGLFGADHPDVALAEVNIAVVDNKRGDPRGALAAFERALAIQERVYGGDHFEVGATHYNITAAALELRDFERAAASAARAVAIYARAVPGSERHTFAVILEAKALAGLGRADEAMARARQATELAAGLDDGTASVAASVEIARANILRGQALADARARLEAARKAYGAYPDVFARRLVEVDELLAAHERAAGRSPAPPRLP